MVVDGWAVIGPLFGLVVKPLPYSEYINSGAQVLLPVAGPHTYFYGYFVLLFHSLRFIDVVIYI